MVSSGISIPVEECSCLCKVVGENFFFSVLPLIAWTKIFFGVSVFLNLEYRSRARLIAKQARHLKQQPVCAACQIDIPNPVLFAAVSELHEDVGEQGRIKSDRFGEAFTALIKRFDRSPE